MPDTTTTRTAKTETAGAPIKLENALCFAVHSANHAITRAYKPLLEPHGLTYPQYLAMLVLWDQDGQTVSQIGEALFLESSTLTPLLKRLEAAGKVRRERDPEDERQVRIFLTDEGRQLRKALKPLPDQMLEAFGCGLAELDSLRQQLTAIRDRVAADRGK
jgi:MarR family transcriptional regulator, organic hydroperoxide resistance regulator